jgi:hypothetical protein
MMNACCSNLVLGTGNPVDHVLRGTISRTLSVPFQSASVVTLSNCRH